MNGFKSICLVPLMLVGCATTLEYEKKLSDWIGHHVDELYAKFGTPSSTHALPDGGKVVQYEQSRDAEHAPAASGAVAPGKAAHDAVPSNAGALEPGYRLATDLGTTAAPPTPAKTRVVSCTTRYRTDGTGTIRAWSYDGKGCKAREEPVSTPP